MKEAIIYLIAITIAEVVTAIVQPIWGIECHILILVAVLLHSALGLTGKPHLQQLVLSLALVPLIRIISLSMPLTNIHQVWWYPIVYMPLLAAAVMVVRILGYKARDIGLNFRFFPIQLAVASTGLVFGVVEYLILTEEATATGLALRGMWLLAVFLLPLCTGFVEEFIFRGVLQHAAVKAFGWWGIVYVSLLFAILHMGFLSWIDVIFVFGVALFFGWVVKKTGSLFGVTLSHSITNLVLFLVAPLFL
ncbi:lysostaphin resistance A-like protein [Chloroflexota bacterium]